MSSVIAGSAAATVVITSPTIHNYGNTLLTSNSPISCSFGSICNVEIIHRSVAASLHDEMSSGERKITINISGTLYETYETTLSKYPATLLGCSQKRNPYYDRQNNQFCFERNREAFNAILFYYQSSGKLIRPYDVPEDVFLDDLQFFEIDPWNVAELEYEAENFTKPKKKILRKFDSETDELVEEDTGDENPENMHVPCDSLLSWPCALFVIVYLFITCLASRHEYESILPTSCGNESKAQPFIPSNNPLVIIHIVCTVWFSFEFVLRFTLSIMKLNYLSSLVGFIDITCVLTTFLQILLRHVDVCQVGALTWFTNLLRAASFACIFKLSRYSKGLRLFGQTLKACSGQLILSLYCVAICLLVFATLIYYAEYPENEGFGSIIDALWYAIVTLTTVGYGDIVPRTVLGRVSGAFCSVFGVTIVMAWPATIFVSYFTEMYNHEAVKKKRKKRSFWSRGLYKFKKGLVRLDKGSCTC